MTAAARAIGVDRPDLGAAAPLGLDWLIAPHPRADLFSDYWERRPLFLERGDAGYYAALPSIDDIDGLFTATMAGSPRLADEGRLTRTIDGVPSERPLRLGANNMPDVQDVYRAYHEGYTLVLGQVHRRSPVVALLARRLEEALHHPVGANLYLTPRGSQGFAAHVDTHDVFILQLHGRKVWRVVDPEIPLPLAWTKPEGPAAMRDPRICTLNPGDLLYIPRGFAHDAVTSASSSLHLTVGVHPFRRIDLVVEALRLFAEENADLRVALPPGFLDDAGGGAPDAASIARAAGDPALLARAAARLGRGLLGGGKAAASSHLLSIDAIDGLTRTSLIARAPGMLCRVHRQGNEAVIQFAGNHVAGPAGIAPTLAFIAARERFVVGELPGPLSPADRIDLVARLVSEGLLLICSPERSSVDDPR